MSVSEAAPPRDFSKAKNPLRAAKRYVAESGAVLGRPTVISADEKTIRTLINCGKIHCTDQEAAAVLGVSYATLRNFFEEAPEARELFEDAKLGGKMSLRRKQMAVALKGNPAMLIWTGKQYLGQSDKTEVSGHLGLEHWVAASLTAPAEPAAIEGSSRVVDDKA